MKIYHEKQIGNYCRCHAINNLVGKQLITLHEFNSYCDKFDALNNFDKGSSRNKHYFYNNGGTNNIFGYCLQKKGIFTNMTHYDISKSTRIDTKFFNKAYGCILYNRRHTYCMRKIQNDYYIIDSMRRTPQKIKNLSILQRKGMGVIMVTPLNK